MKFDRWIIIALLVILAGVSCFGIASKASNPKTYEKTITALDEKKDNVLKLTAAATTSSAAVSALPGDTCTPIAEKLADMSGYFMVVLCAIYLEKYLLTIIGIASFRILIPIGLLLVASYFLVGNIRWRRVGTKLIGLGLALFLVIPSSMWVSTKVENTYADAVSFGVEIDENDKIVDKDPSSEANVSATDATTEEKGAAATSESKKTGLINSIGSGVSSIVNGAAHLTEEAGKVLNNATGGALENAEEAITGKLSGIREDAETMLNNFIEAAAVMIITSCVIPLLVLAFFFWMIKIVLDVDFAVPDLAGLKRK